MFTFTEKLFYLVVAANVFIIVVHFLSATFASPSARFAENFPHTAKLLVCVINPGRFAAPCFALWDS